MSLQRENTDDYRQIFLSGAPLIDLRAPCEFAQGAFEGAVNLPLMSDDERAQVGTCYKLSGQQAAIELGHQLVCGSLKERRLQAWQDFVSRNPQGYLYCFRGGLRSRTVQQWLNEVGDVYPLIEGGYKAMRRFLIDETCRISQQLPMYLLSGFTGVGKTLWLHKVAESIDLEGLANHRGSSFGGQMTRQPTQIGFENAIALALLKLENEGAEHFLVEDESRLIGSRSIPLEFHHQMLKSPIIVMTLDFELRVQHIQQEYVVERLVSYQESLEGSDEGEDPVETLHQYLSGAIYGIRRRLGSERHTHIQSLLSEAIDRQKQTGDCGLHQSWIAELLKEYYDPMYRYQLAKKQERVIFEGDALSVSEFIADSLATSA